jgi:hypothetical protein
MHVASAVPPMLNERLIASSIASGDYKERQLPIHKVLYVADVMRLKHLGLLTLGPLLVYFPSCNLVFGLAVTLAVSIPSASGEIPKLG